MEDILKIAAMAVISAICAVVVKKNVRELGLVLSLTAGVLILVFMLPAVEQVRAFMEEMTRLAELAPEVLAPVVRTVGIAIVTRVSAEVCRDAGESGIASFLETGGAAAALLAVLPLLETVLELIKSLM